MNYKTRQPFPHAAYVEGQRNFTYFDRSLTSGLTDVVIESPGDFLYIDQASTGVVSVELNMRQGGTLAPILLAAGGSIECDFASIKLTASAQLGKTVRVVVGNGARIKSGANVNATSEVISVTNGEKTISNAGNSFMRYFGANAVVGQYTHAQIYNPANSGKTVYVSSVVPLGYAMAITGYSTALSTLYGYGQSLKIGNADSVTQLRTQASATPLYTQYFGVAAVGVRYLFDRPACLTPGSGLVLAPQGTNSECYLTCEFFEE